MLKIQEQAKFLGVKELPPKPPYPQACSVLLLVGDEPVRLIGRKEVLDSLAEVNKFEDVLFEASLRPAPVSGAGNLFRLALTRVLAGGTKK